MKIIQALIIAFAIIGCLALALGGYFVYNMTQSEGDNFLTRLQQARANQAETTATATAAATPVVAKNSEYAAIIQQYQPTPTPTPVPQQVAAGAAPGAAPVAAAPVAAAPTARPINTPGPDAGKIRNWPTGRKYVALTYDDGPHREWTPKLMELLQSKNVKATFFLLGQEIKRFPDIARQVADAGFEIGNHTITHPDFNKSAMTPEKIREELVGTNELIKEHATQQPTRVMRPPYGNTPKKLEEVCKELGLHIIAWDVDTNDWDRNTDAAKMVDNIMKNVTDGSIILMHDRHQKTYDTTAEVVDKLREQGYEFVTMSELLGLTAVQPQQQAVAAAPQAAPVQQQPAAPAAQPAANQAAVPQAAPPAQAPAAATLGALPVPAAAQATEAPTADTLDSSKITRPPGS